MPCNQITTDKLIFLIQGELPEQEASFMNSHVVQCSVCAAKLQQAQTIVQGLGSDGSWEKRNETNFQYTQTAGAGVMTQQSDNVTITDTYLDNQETLGDQIQEQIKKAPWWILSFVLNGILLLLTTMIMIAQAKEDKSKKIIQAELPKPQEPEYEPEKDREVVEEKKDIPQTDPEVTEKSEVVPMENVEVSDHMEAETDSDFNEMAEADADNQLMAENSGDVGNFSGLGAGGGSGGAFGTRGAGGRKWLLKKGSGSKATESAVTAALEWLKRHQKEEGWWSSHWWQERCGNNPYANKFPGKCDFSNDFQAVPDISTLHYGKGLVKGTFTDGRAKCNTALSMLAFFGQGYSHKRGRYKKTLKKAVEFLIKSEAACAQKHEPAWFAAHKNGEEKGFGLGAVGEMKYSPFAYGTHRSGYGTGPITLAILEAYGVSKDAYLKPLARRMATFQCAQIYVKEKGDADKNKGGFSGSMGGSKLSDLSGSSFPFMVVMDVKALGMKLDKEVWDYLMKKDNQNVEMPGAKEVAKRNLKYLNTCVRGEAFKSFVYTPNQGSLGSLARSGIGLFSLSKFSKLKPEDNLVRAIVKGIIKGHPVYKTYGKNDSMTGTELLGKGGERKWYELYYNTLALFQYAEKTEWETWNKLVSGALVSSQEKFKELPAGKKCQDGSWGEAPPEMGRPYATATGALMLEVYYRYKKMHKSKK